ncbi:MAG: pyruvate dehydrogenase (acetyl-transferring), homodimeric type [Candidatus Cyclobacteriaceae bacterium M2_1C_046]
MKNDDGFDLYEVEVEEWLKSLEYLLQEQSSEKVGKLLTKVIDKARKRGVNIANVTDYINSIPVDEQEPYPGDLKIEKKIINAIRWNAMAMVVKANKKHSGIGGHISTYASTANLFEVGFNHFFRKKDDGKGDLIYFQGHASPGVYARSFVEHRFSEEDLKNFRQEADDKGLSSYPHARLMPDYWKFPTVSMGLSPIQAIYQARFAKYLTNRKLIKPSDQKIWSFLGDGEMDEPESLGALTVASKERLNNLVFVINCNLQRLDGPVRGNGKVISELEGIFRGAGWSVIKVLWGEGWDPLFEKEHSDKLIERLNETIDGQFQKYSISDGDYIRKEFFGKSDELLSLVKDMDDEELERLNRGGHDAVKIYNAYKEATEDQHAPVVVLAQTVKGYGLGEAGEASNVTHQQKKLDADELKNFRDRFKVPISDEEIEEVPFYRFGKDSKEYKYLKEKREKLGGWVPERKNHAEPIKLPDDELYKDLLESSGDREVATTMVVVKLMSELIKDKNIGERIVPIVPDESRTFGMEALFKSAGIYSSVGQNYTPVDEESLLSYNEEKSGAILEEGITEAGCMSSFIAAGTAHVNYGLDMIPFFLFYSMFGFQRVGDLIWAAGDTRARGFLIGATSGRTTLNGEGLQHQDGHSHLTALGFPNIKAYDPAYAYEVAIIVKEGLRRMYKEREDLIYYITVLNEKYPMPAMPEGVEDGILKGMYKLKEADGDEKKVHLLGSGSLLNKAIKAKEILKENYDVNANVWSVTSYKALYDDAREAERWNRLNPEKDPKQNYIQSCFADESAPVIATSDYVKALPLTISNWVENEFIALGTDGFGRSDTREALRDLFEVDERYIALAALQGLYDAGELKGKVLEQAKKDLSIDPDKINPTAK